MKRLDEGKVSLVEFLRSIKFAGSSADEPGVECPARFAQFHQRAPSGEQLSAEDSQLIRSAN